MALHPIHANHALHTNHTCRFIQSCSRELRISRAHSEFPTQITHIAPTSYVHPEAQLNLASFRENRLRTPVNIIYSVTAVRRGFADPGIICVESKLRDYPLALYYSIHFAQVFASHQFCLSPNAAHGCLDRGSSASGWRHPRCVALLLVFGYQRHRQSLSLDEAIHRLSLSSHWCQGFLPFPTFIHSYMTMVTSA